MKALSYTLFGIALAFTAISMSAPQYADRLGMDTGVGVSVTAFDVVVALAFLALGWWLLEDLDVPLSNLELAVVAFVVAYLVYQILIVVAFGIASGLSPVALLRAISPRLSIVLLPVLYGLLRSGMRPEALVRAISLVAAGVALVVVVRFALVGPVGGVSALGFRLREAWGGSILLMGWLLLAAIIFKGNGLVSLVASLLAAFAIVLTNHRSGYVALLAALLFHFALNTRKSGKALGIALAVTMVVIIAVSFMPVVSRSASYSVVTMFVPNADMNTRDRMVSAVAAWNEFTERPFGDIAWHPTDNYALQRWDAHNLVFQVLAAEGIVGFAFHAALWTTVFVVALRGRRENAVLRFCATYLVFYLTFCLFNTNFYATGNAVLLMSAGALVLAVASQASPSDIELPSRHPAGRAGMPVTSARGGSVVQRG